MSIDQIQEHDDSARVVELRSGERLVLWQPQDVDEVVWGGGARASFFVFNNDHWRHVGDVDSKSNQSSVNLAFVAADGVAVLVESFEGNGWPPERAFAVAIIDGVPATVESDDVASVDVVEARREIRLRRWVWPINPYKDREPLGVTSWSVARREHGLVVVERSLTPWIDVLAEFCNFPRPELADGAVLGLVSRCLGPATLRWQPDNSIVATIDLRMFCGEEGETDTDGRLILRKRGNAWRVVAVRGCDE